MKTTMDELDDKVREFAANILEHEDVVTGWVLAVTSTRFDDEGDECYRTSYSCGPGTSPTVARGLIETARDRIVHDLTCCDAGD